MKLSAALLAALAAAPSLAKEGDQAYLGIFVETSVMQIAGVKMPAMPKLPPGFKLPASAMAMMPGRPHRSLNVRLWSPSIAPDNATASVAIPPELKLGDKLDLQLYRPNQPEIASSGPGTQTRSDHKDLTVKIYWGSSETVREGQPKIFTTANMTPNQAMQMTRMMGSMSRMGGGGRRGGGSGGSYFYKDGWTTAYWPKNNDPGEVPDDATMPGKYALSTNYAGNVSLDAPSDVNFLAPIEITSPDMESKPNLANAITLNWTAIPNALGIYAAAFGMEQDTNTITLWCSSENFDNQIMEDNGFLQMAEVKSAVDRKVFLPGDATAVSIPAGIFKDVDVAMYNMTGYGPGTALAGTQPLPRIQTKTSLNLLLGGKKAGRGR